MELIIVRHGETEWTISGQYTGVTDLPLTPNGRRQAERLQPLAARRLDGQNLVVYTSPRQRAIDTAERAFPAGRSPPEPLLAEYGYGDYEGLTTKQITKQRPGWDIWRDGCPNGESTDEVGARADTFLRQAIGTSTHTTVVVVTHGHFSRVLAAVALGLDARQGQLFASDTASISAIGDHHGKRCIQLRNMTVDPAETHNRTPLVDGSPKQRDNPDADVAVTPNTRHARRAVRTHKPRRSGRPRGAPRQGSGSATWPTVTRCAASTRAPFAALPRGLVPKCRHT